LKTLSLGQSCLDLFAPLTNTPKFLTLLSFSRSWSLNGQANKALFCCAMHSHLKLPAMEPTYFEVLFSKSGVQHVEHFSVCIELNDEDKSVLELGGSVEVRTRAIVRRSGILHFLPNGLDDDWPCSGRVMTCGIEGPMAMGTKPTSANERRVWIVDQHKGRE
jgi:hypothetical protein